MRIAPYICIILLLLIIFWQWKCNHVPPSKIDTKEVDSLYKAIDLKNKKIIADSIEYELQKKLDDSDRENWLQEKEETEKRLANKIASLTFSVMKYKTAALARDTVGQVINCQEIVDELDSVYTQALVYKNTIDSLQKNADGRRNIDSSEVGLLRQVIMQDGQDLERLKGLLTTAMAENEGLRKALLKSKRGRWLLGALGVLVGGVIVGSVK